ncbi:cysteine-rich receptor-like protein kinase [Trifolium pratense]|uniref:non-specific serine/threonine protein kinase n=1 Tax=Trifolium pratense TaxID=57577 RepID=A0A2K3LIR6_TRIPR|nr:cysteine-rich receptor-like protein kinase [Trifolium pratense]
MTYMKFLSFKLLLLFLVFHFTPTSAQVPIYLYNFCENSTAKSLSSSYKSNVNNFVSWIASDSAKGTTFNQTIIGSSSSNSNTSDDVYGNYDCRFDISESFCQFCVSTATRDLVQHCPNSVTSVIFYDVCIIRYSNENFFGKVSMTPTWNVTGTKIIKDSTYLTKVEGYIRILIRKMTIETNQSWAMGEFNLSNTEKRYGFAQCGRDVDNDGCRQCLEAMLEIFPKCCGNRVSWEVVAPSCGIKFDDQTFFMLNGKTGSSSKPNPANQEDSSNKKTLVIALVSALVAVALLCCCIYYYWRKNGLRKGGFLLKKTTPIAFNDNVQRDDTLNGDLPMIPFNVIQQATNYFSISSKLGEGGFGPVYKGTLPDGTEIAVKRLADTSDQGSEEFKNEVIFIAKLQHRNLVKLLGCCIEDDEKILVYEYMPNSSLDFHLFGMVYSTYLLL